MPLEMDAQRPVPHTFPLQHPTDTVDVEASIRNLSIFLFGLNSFHLSEFIHETNAT